MLMLTALAVCLHEVTISYMNKTFLLAALSFWTMVCQADIIDIRWSAEGRFEHQTTVAPTKFVELCGKLPAGQRVHWEFAAGVPLDFNVHYHVGKEVVYPSKLKAVASAQDTLLTRLDQDYCWMWTNKSAVAAELSVKLRRH
jgi:hypothetical protein